jgi:ABC-type polysaccharide/polyol phosphate transport system ATPase subunit
MITLENISKQYKLKGQKNLSRFFIVRMVKDIIRGVSHKKDNNGNTFLAVNNVSLTIKAGEHVGLIGKNKAGKTTLLQMITGITEPSQGKLHVDGRIIPVFAQGTVLTPDQSGREYIYLHSAALGYSRKFVDTVIDDIIAFSEIEQIDGMVKFYSTGTRTRLSLSIILHLPADIFIFDEVFYGSDIFFKEKVIARIKELMSAPGKCMVLVSHNEDIIRTFCDRLILLEHGRVIKDGPTDEILAHYKLK